MKKISIAILVLSLAAGLIFAVACGGDNDDEELCSYDAVNELCQRAYDCCVQYVDWALEQGQQGYDQSFCVPYTCVDTPDSTCQSWIDQALLAETTYQENFSECH